METKPLIPEASIRHTDGISNHLMQIAAVPGGDLVHNAIALGIAASLAIDVSIARALNELGERIAAIESAPVPLSLED